jgi:hypothetical protein
MPTKKHKNPTLAAYLKVVLPGLGCAYLGKWGYALLFLVWTPLRQVAALLAFDLIRETFVLPLWGAGLLYVALYLWQASVLADTALTPYNLALAHNQQ